MLLLDAPPFYQHAEWQRKGSQDHGQHKRPGDGIVDPIEGVQVVRGVVPIKDFLQLLAQIPCLALAKDLAGQFGSDLHEYLFLDDTLGHRYPQRETEKPREEGQARAPCQFGAR